jgi:uncharacterized protein YdcH (DUF465 family)
MDKKNPVIKTLLHEDDEFKALYAEHEELEGKLAALDSLHYLSPEQELERRQHQKLKLRGRDRMEEIIQMARNRVAL